MRLLQTARRIRRNLTRYHPSVEVLIDKQALIGNLRFYQQKYPDLAIAPVLKSNAYGHGLVTVAGILDDQQIPFFVLDSLFEAMILRREGIKSPILVIGYTQTENVIGSRQKDVAFTITGLEQLQELAKKLDKPLTIHLKIDTGMHRQGIMSAQIAETIRAVRSNPQLHLEGICSHLADAEDQDTSFTDSQIASWRQAISQLRPKFPSIRYVHLLATTGMPFALQSGGNVARIGKGLFGFSTDAEDQQGLKPVMSMRSLITTLRSIEAGEHVGYSITYQAKKRSLIATIPAGYYEGIDRRLSNKGHLTVSGRPCPIVGRVSMNITSLDVTGVPDVCISDEVIILSAKRCDPNSVENIARLCDTIPSDILVHVPQHLRRAITG